MNTLEKLAKGLFERYSKRTTGQQATWSFLSPLRQAAWMNEALIVVKHVVFELKIRFKDIPEPKPNQTSFAQGFNQGVASERLSILEFLSYIIDDLDEELDDFAEEHKLQLEE